MPSSQVARGLAAAGEDANALPVCATAVAPYSAPHAPGVCLSIPAPRFDSTLSTSGRELGTAVWRYERARRSGRRRCGLHAPRQGETAGLDMSSSNVDREGVGSTRPLTRPLALSQTCARALGSAALGFLLPKLTPTRLRSKGGGQSHLHWRTCGSCRRRCAACVCSRPTSQLSALPAGRPMCSMAPWAWRLSQYGKSCGWHCWQ